MKESNQTPQGDREAKPVLRLRSGLALSKVEVPETSNRKGKIIAVSISKEKGTKKINVEFVELKENFGIIGDAHAEGGVRQVSLLAVESINKIRSKELDVASGDFAENITTEEIDLPGLKVGSKLKIGKQVFLEISQIGKECHARCNIYYQVGDCVMPGEGVFARVLKGGTVRPGERLEVIN